MKRKLEDLKFCSLRCKYAKPDKDVTGCLAHNPIYCRRYDMMWEKGAPCLEHSKEK